jgi:hypothetical protein
MKKISHLFTLLFLVITCSSCAQKGSFEGIITYKSEERIYNIPKDSITLVRYYVKGNKIATVSESNFGGQRYIRDMDKMTGTLLLKMNGQKFALIQDLRLDTVHAHFIVKKQRGKKKIAGVKSQKYSVSGEYLDSAIIVYISKKYPSNIINIYGGLPGFPTKYPLILKGESVHYELKSIQNQPITEDIFFIPPD